MVTIKDVARESGVAISTVSNVLNDVGNVSQETAKRVLETVERLKYVPNVNAKYLKTNKKNTIGLLFRACRVISTGSSCRQCICNARSTAISLTSM